MSIDIVALSTQFPGLLPGRCVLFLSDSSTGGPVAGTPVGLRARYRVQWPTTSGEGIVPAPQESEFLLGILATDHVGYASWDLDPLITRFKLIIDEIGDAAEKPVLLLDSLTIRLAGPLALEIEALDNAQLGSDAFAKSYSTDVANLFQLPAGTCPSVQNPSLVDWTLSPASFAFIPTALVGQDGCETLLPSNVATQRFKAYQVANPRLEIVFPGPRLFSNDTNTTLDAGTNAPVVFPEVADLLTYLVSWLPAGHGLGQILYSMPLAPGEQVNLAVVDWARTDTASRQEQTGLTDTITHDTLRDRNVGEVVDASLREYQRGSTSMAGASITGGVSGALGGALSLGTTYSTSSGQRDLAATTTQTLTDQFHQASAAVRDLRSTVVVQSTQQVSQNLQTRTVRNHNHSHSLTLLYYEVLRHYRVVTELVAVGSALLWREPLPDFATVTQVDTPDVSLIFRYRRFLEPALLVEELRPGFDAIEKLFALIPPQEPPPADPPAPPDPAKFQFVLFDFAFHVGGESNELRVKGTVRRSNNDVGSEVRLIGVPDPDDTILANPDNFKKVDFTVLGQGVPDGGVLWENAGLVWLELNATAQSGADTCITLLEIKATDSSGTAFVLHGKESSEICVPQGTLIRRLFSLAAPPPPPEKPPVLSPLQRLTPEERSLRARLIAHLNENKAYYYRQIWVGEDPNERRIRLGTAVVNVAGQQMGLFDAVENRVVDVVGDQLVFPLNPSLVGVSAGLNVYGPAVSETLISLPTRGVFGEAKLGHCNASEIIDNTRFWDWQTSPIPEDAPSISGVTPQGTGSAVAVTATGLPASLISQAQPSAEPDPIGLRAALDVLKTPGIFNNMTGVDQLKSLLGSLSDAAAKVAAKSDDKSGSGSSSGSGGSGGGAGGGKGGGGSGGPSGGGDTGGSGSGSGSGAGAGSGSSGAGSGGTKDSSSGGNTPPTKSPPAGDPVPPKPMPAQKRAINLSFVYTTDERLMGSWQVTLRSPTQVSSPINKMINDNDGVSGVAVGNRMELIYDADFGGTADLELVVEGGIVSGTPQLGAGLDLINFGGKPLHRSFIIKLTRAEFDASPSYVATQKLASGGFDLEVKITGLAGSATVKNEVNMKSLGVVSVIVTQADKNAAPEALVDLSVLGLHDAVIASSSSTAGNAGRVDQFTIKAAVIGDGPPDITKLN